VNPRFANWEVTSYCLRAAVGIGINFIVAENTYQGYTRVVSSAGGIGEAMLSRAFRKNRNQIVLAIKVGMKFGPEKDDLTPSH
jgi:aryl-alcohol dehydrogenase-like predicted oxidoreductase